jgi:hypothetical protein
MRVLRRFSIIGLALLLSVGVACTSTDTLTEASSTSSSDQQTPQFGLLDGLTDGLTNTVGDLTNTVGDLTTTVVGTLGNVTDLLLCSPQPYAKDIETIGPDGGSIRVGTHTLIVPQGALTSRVTITAEQLPGKTNSIRFSPEGLQFERPAILTMTYGNCALVLLQKKIVYTDEKLQILEVLKTLDLFQRKQATAGIDHFSRYAVAY